MEVLDDKIANWEELKLMEQKEESLAVKVVT